MKGASISATDCARQTPAIWTVTVFLEAVSYPAGVSRGKASLGRDTDVAARTPDRAGVARGRRAFRGRRGRLPPPAARLPAALPAPVLPGRAPRAGGSRLAGQAQRPAAQDLRAHRPPGRPPAQARAALRR